MNDALERKLDELRSFVSRRFDEISFEINATSQIVDMNEEATAGRFAEVMALLQAVSFNGQGTTPHNVGVELNAVVKTTEDAANRILDAASAIADLTKQTLRWTDEASRTQQLAAINRHADTILAACAFQDLTGQRIARTLENIRKAEEELADTLARMGIRLEATDRKTALLLGDTTSHAQSQADIDALFQ